MLQKILNTQKMSNIIKQNNLSLLRMHLINTLYEPEVIIYGETYLL